MHWSSNSLGSGEQNVPGASTPKTDVTLPDPEGIGNLSEASAGFKAAVAAAMTLVEHVGAADDPIVISVAGYAYAGHAPNGEPNEVITITVAARPEDKPAPPDEMTIAEGDVASMPT